MAQIFNNLVLFPFSVRQTLRLILALVCLWAVNAWALKPDYGENEETQLITLDARQQTRIAVNQIGYLPDAPKRAILLNAASQEPLQLVQTPDRLMLELPLEPERAVDKAAQGLQNQWVDFSKIRLPGEYFLRQGELKSAVFRIGADVYANPSWLLQRSYYLQRCGVALHDPISDLEHAACHTGDALYARTDEINAANAPHEAAGGWHDAGDFGKYMATATVTVNRLMSLYLMQPQRYRDGDLYIPESGNGKPDLLDEVTFELTWMLKMQRMDGAVYRKLAGPKWVSARKPEDDTEQRYIYGVTAPETAKFAASMALAARTYRDVSLEDAARYRVAAEHAWGWLEKHPAMEVDWQKADDGGSGKYLSSGTDTEASLEFDDDDRLTAAIEMYLTTGERKYRDYVLAVAPDMPYSLYEWKDASALSLWHLLTYDKTPELAPLRKDINSKLLARADDLLVDVENCPLRMANQRLVWGSNKMLAEEGITLLHAWRYTGDERYLEAALDQVDYLFGRNPFAQSFITMAGESAVKTPLHLWGTAIKRTIPGLLVGGPNVLAQDKVAPRDQGIFSYVDDERAYSVNEYAIDYNAALIGLLETLAIYRSQPQ
ncbi:MAG: glycoside hydrolase family 9 protein [Gammaproteobacteria bacterium]|nr:glycoside hydrolase family 9 protein [Gammaproteobacteria bacterium]MBU1724534.1 glycoside hydrolase family 9 protein [Gammaproteobacteria bacterium]MBU2004577.1 glycoside hydrolase family 9 protein [Gammaproteobacteria bacterium]